MRGGAYVCEPTREYQLNTVDRVPRMPARVVGTVEELQEAHNKIEEKITPSFGGGWTRGVFDSAYKTTARPWIDVFFAVGEKV